MIQSDFHDQDYRDLQLRGFNKFWTRTVLLEALGYMSKGLGKLEGLHCLLWVPVRFSFSLISSLLRF